MHNGRTLQSSLSKMTSQLTKVDHTLGYSASSQQRSQYSKKDDFIEDVQNFNETAHNEDKSEYYRQLLQNYTKESTSIQHELLLRNEELERENITLKIDLQHLKQNSDLTIQQLQLRLSAFELYSHELKNTQTNQQNIINLQNELDQIKADKTHQIQTGNEAVEWIKKQVLEQNKKYELEIAELKRKLK
ncbi:Hypothetical_protein [Hexamita inflata]|uniref:Hypothetical_protein n=1 Tax=Hexamita inflata TaxID=28002 RepID=A0ABP1GUE9_9EUKA